VSFQLFQLPKQQNVGPNLVPLASAKAYFYATGTTTPQDTYSDSTLETEHDHPVVADTAGRFPAIYLDPLLAYKVVITTASGVEIYEADPCNDQAGLASATQAQVGAIFQPRTQAEIDASITPTNYEYPQGHVNRYGTNTTPGTTDMTTAVQAAFSVAQEGGGEVIFNPAETYLYTDLMTLTEATNIRVRGNGATIKARLTATENVWTFLDCEDICIEDLDFDGGYSVTTFSNQILSFRNPIKCEVRNSRFSDWLTSAVLMFTDDLGVAGTAGNNHVRHCYCNGGGVANAGFLLESLFRSSIESCITEGVGGTSPGYAQQLKNSCIECQIIDGIAKDCYTAFVCSAPDTADTVGNGVTLSKIRGKAIGCTVGGLVQKTNRCDVDLDIDMADNDDAAAVAFINAARNIETTATLSLRNINSARNCVEHSSSDDCSYWVRAWDGTGALLWEIGDGGAQTGAERNRMFLADRMTNIAFTVEPLAKVDDQSGSTGSASNQFVFLRDLMEFALAGEPRITFPIAGMTRGVNFMNMTTNGWLIRHNNSDSLQYSASGAAIRTGTDATIALGSNTVRWLNVFSSKLTVIDGITAPPSIAGHAQIYVDSADGDLKVIFADGTVKTIVTDT
jgi:hypothetical protein